jgi:CBS domain-containing protein
LQDIPVHEWELATLDESAGLHQNYMFVEQFMTTDLFTVREDELVDLAAFLMDKKQIRHVLVEDSDHILVGLISYRTLLRLIADRGISDLDETLSARDIMETDPVTISPTTKTIDAILLMRTKKVSALPVIKDGKLIGIVSERDFMAVAGDLLSEKLREGELAKEYGED